MRYCIMLIILICACTTYDRVDYTNECPKIKEQGDVGACTAFAIAYAMERLIKLEHNKDVTLSELYLFNNSKIMSGNTLQYPQEGVTMHMAFYTLMQYGICEDKDFPYTLENTTKVPPNKKSLDVIYVPTGFDNFLPSIKSFKQRLDNKKTIICALAVHPGVYFGRDGEICAKYGIAYRQIVPGHAMHIVGYDDKTKMFKAQNSYGDDMGDNGFAYIPYDMVNHPMLITESFTINGVTIVSNKN